MVSKGAHSIRKANGMKIVIIDDNKTVVQEIAEVARSVGHEVLEILVHSIEQFDAIPEQIKEFAPDIVFLDHNLRLGSEKNGEILAVQIKLPREKYVGTSVVGEQEYCQSTFGFKTLLHEEWAQEKLRDFLSRQLV